MKQAPLKRNTFSSIGVYPNIALKHSTRLKHGNPRSCLTGGRVQPGFDLLSQLPHERSYLPVHTTEKWSYDMILLLGLYSIWTSRMVVRHADVNVQPVHFSFIEITTRVKALHESLHLTIGNIGFDHGA